MSNVSVPCENQNKVTYINWQAEPAVQSVYSNELNTKDNVRLTVMDFYPIFFIFKLFPFSNNQPIN